MAEPMNYEQALASGATWFYWQHDGDGWFLEEISQIKDWRGSNAEDSEFLPIPTPEELLSEVECEVNEVEFPKDNGEYDNKIMVELPSYKFIQGDRVRVWKVTR